jgi:predicted dehydrogenase
MLREIQPALVVVSREAQSAPEAVRAALEANAHVIVEKPGCTSLRAFDGLMALADSRQRQVMLALATRLHPAARKAREILQTGALGKPFGASMHWIGDQTRLKNPAYHKSWYASRSRAGGGKLLLHGLHYIDLIAFFTGEHVAKVAAICANVGGQPIEVEDAAAVGMQFTSGWNATLNTGYYLDKGFANLVQVWCAKGWLRFDPGAEPPLEWQANGERVQSFTPPEHDSYVLMFDSAVRMCMGQEPPFVTTRECRAALNTVFSAYRAAETGAAQAVV